MRNIEKESLEIEKALTELGEVVSKNKDKIQLMNEAYARKERMEDSIKDLSPKMQEEIRQTMRQVEYQALVINKIEGLFK